MPNLKAKHISSLRRLIVRSSLLLLAVGVQTRAQSEKVPRAYLEVRWAMGRSDFADAYARADRLFRQKEIYPSLYVTAAYLFVYEKRFAAGHAFFDSLLAAGHHPGNVAGAHAILWQTQQQPDSSLRYARQAVMKNSSCEYPYEIFAEKSFELKNNETAFELLQHQRRRHPENWRLVFALALCHSRAGEYRAACDSLRALLNRNIEHWRIYYALGSNLWPIVSWQEAKKVYEQGIRYCEQAHDDEGLLRMLHGRAQAESALGQRQEATATLQRGLELSRELGNRVLEGRLLLLLGETRLQQHQWSEARQILGEVAQRAQRYSDIDLLLNAYHYLSLRARDMGNRGEALAYAHKAYQVADSSGRKTYAVSRLLDIALIEFAAGRKAQALELMQQVLQYALEHKLDWQFSYIYQNLATILNALGRYPEALRHCEKADRLAHKNPQLEQLLKLTCLRGEILMHLGQAAPARTLLSEAAVAAKKARRMTPFMYAQVLLAQLDIRAQQFAQARSRLARAVAAAPEALAYETNLRIQTLLADIAVQLGHEAGALKIYDEAARIIVTQTHRMGPEHLSTLSGVEREIFFRLSRAYLQTGQVERALAETERARDLIVKRRRWHLQQLRAGQTANVEFHELARLDSLLQQARLQKVATNSVEMQLNLAAKIGEWERRQAELQSRILGINAAPWLDTVPVPIKNFQQSLQARNELALSFFVGDSATLVFFIAADTLQAKTIAMGRQGLEQQLQRIHHSMNTTNANALANAAAIFDTAAARNAHLLLFGNLLIDRPETALVIVPDGVLHALPFEILPMAAETQHRTSFLIERFAVRYLSTLADLQQDDQDHLAINSFVLAADPVLYPAQAGGLLAQRNASSWLPEVGKLEANTISNLVKCEAFLTRAKLTRASLLQALRRGDWLHFASHSFWQPAEPLFGEIILSMPAAMHEPEKIFAFEIFQMSLPLRMAILSGCETARGTFVESEGFEGFVQAFRAAGTPSVIASLWKVDDYAAAEFFKSYYEALRAGQSTVRALQTAKLKMLNHPNYNFTDWAAFAYYGRDWRVELPQPSPSINGTMLAALIAVLLLAAGLLVWQWRRTKAR